ncbi:MAG: hypothetical protein FJW63_01850 [Actinobacteria bacterium]|nr:hypothetical protein [Actinomycetota bacterium]
MKNILLPLGDIFKKIVKTIPAVVSEVEKAMKDGKIDFTERKDLAMKTIDLIAQEFGVKLGVLVRLVISFLVDKIAQKLPSKDIKVPDVVFKITKTF